jgi:hypothetical protein
MRTVSRTTALAAAMVLLMISLAAVSSLGQHTVSLTNIGNDLVVVEGDAENPDGLEAGYGHIVVKETIAFASDVPGESKDYGIVFIDPAYDVESTYPRVSAYEWTFTVANYTLTLWNETDDWNTSITDIETNGYVIQPEDLNPDEPGADHPKVNATYHWFVKSVDIYNKTIDSAYGGEVTMNATEPTVFDFEPLEIPDLGLNDIVADFDMLLELSLFLVMEPHESLAEGWYRVYISQMVFEYNTTFAIDVQYRGEKVDRKAILNKLIFTPRHCNIEVYLGPDSETFAYDNVEGEGNPIAPVSESTGPGVPTVFHSDTIFSIVIQEEGTDETDWDLYGRYALLFLLIAALMILVLWSGPRRKGTGDEDEDYEEDEEDEEVQDKLSELEAEKSSILAAIKELDQRHEDGELGEGVWKRKRKALKKRAVDVMKQIEALEEGED